MSLAKRIRAIEERLQVGAVTVKLRDGRTVHIRRCDVWELLYAAHGRAADMIEGRPIRCTRFDAALDLLTRAEERDLPADEPLLGVVVSALQPPPAAKVEDGGAKAPITVM
jgi:hypothetical protein